MRRLFKQYSSYFILSIILFNVYIIYQYLIQHENNNQNSKFLNKKFVEKNNNEFLVLDWTAKQHIFQEEDPIKCNFSHITPSYCQTIFNSIINNTQRFYLIERCIRSSKLTVRWTNDQSRLKQADLISYHSIHMPYTNLPKLIRNHQQQQFSMVYILESEVYSSNGQYWHQIDFPMWYHLERSYPEPITYFDLSVYLKYLFTPIYTPFSTKTTSAPIVWISSNCGAYNGRHLFIKELMSYIRIDSYGKCLNNINSNAIKRRQQSNSIIYSSYKFVIAIENSNCEDYITEKLINAYASTSIPIVAGRNNKPDYRRFTPNHSYINIYDYKSIKELADYLNYLSNNETAYNEYLWFRNLAAKKSSTPSNDIKPSLKEYLHLADDILSRDSSIRKWLLTKEKSMNKYCKLVQFIYTNPWESIYNHTRFDRPMATDVCLPKNDLLLYYSIPSSAMKNSIHILSIVSLICFIFKIYI